LKKILRSENFPVVVLLAASFLAGVFTIHDYGESWDEYNFFRYAGESLAAYQNLYQPDFTLTFTDPTLRYYGAGFLMTILMAGRVFPNWYISEVAHLLTFITFLFGVFIFYLLARRWLGRWSAFCAAALFALQPVLWGHGFINARDIPFMVGFLATIHFGLRWSDSLTAADFPSIKQEPAHGSALMRSDWDVLSRTRRFILILLAVIGIIGFALLLPDLGIAWRARAVSLADTSSASELDAYLRPILATFWMAVVFLALSLTWLALLFLPVMPSLRRRLWEVEAQPILSFLWDMAQKPAFWGAALALGFGMGIRIMGFAAGGLIVLYLLWRHGRKSLLPALVYFLTAFVPLYLSWPYLWTEPLLRLLLTLRVMMRFPWPGEVLFNGAYYAGNELPRSYLPTLFAFQLTEPLVLLSVFGLAILIWGLFKKRTNLEAFLLIAGWFGLPLSAAMLGRPYMYDNFRQFLFILPPLFLLAGFGIEFIFSLFKRTPLKVIALLLILLPGVWGMFRLHPYEYIYYNQFAGGVSNSSRRFEMDYWGTSFREAAGYLNASAPENSAVVVWGPATTLWRFVRDDIRVYDFREPAAPKSDFYAVILTRNDNDLRYYIDLPAEFMVEKDGALLSVVKFVP
jgi:hypothetical protein